MPPNKHSATPNNGQSIPANAPLQPSDVESRITSFYNDFTINQRYASYDFCYTYFQTHKGSLVEDMEKSCYCLWSYLGSWGMLRGSGQLLQCSPATLKLLISYFDIINPSPIWTIDVPQYMQGANHKLILEVYTDIKAILDQIVFRRKGKASVTLITKIMLGVFGVVPALDNNFKRAFHNHFRTQDGNPIPFSSTLGIDQLYAINNFYRDFKTTLDTIRIETLQFDGTPSGKTYKIAKLIDMFGFVYGKELSKNAPAIQPTTNTLKKNNP